MHIEPTTFRRRTRTILFDPDRDGGQALSRRLEQAGQDVEHVRSVAQILGAVDRRPPDLVIMTLRLGMSEGQIATLRSRSEAPLLALLPPDSELDEPAALNAGADAAFEHPFRMDVMLARCGALMRRWTSEHRGSPARAAVLRYGNLMIDPQTREVMVQGELVALPRREFDVLLRLAVKPRQVFTRRELLREVWGDHEDWIGPATVTEHVRRLRERLRTSGASPHIRTVRSVGYRFEPGPDG